MNNFTEQIEKPYLIAEIGCNHKGDMDLAKDMIKNAAEFCGVNAVKFQKRNPKELLTEKYGEPAKSVEKWDSYSKPLDDGSRMHEVKFDNCKYYTIYETENGDIQLSIDHQSIYSCYVILSYFDKINSEKKREKAKGDL